MPNDVLLKAAELIEDNGLYQSGTPITMINLDYTCIVLALDDAALAIGASLNEAERLVGKVADYLELSYVDDLRAVNSANRVVIKWNDTPGRTAEEVVRVLREVAELE